MDERRRTSLMRRLKSIQGHVGGIMRMVENDEYCIDIVHQVAAVEKALQKVSGLVLDHHLHHCAIAAIRGEDPAERERVLGEILNVFEGKRKRG